MLRTCLWSVVGLWTIGTSFSTGGAFAGEDATAKCTQKCCKQAESTFNLDFGFERDSEGAVAAELSISSNSVKEPTTATTNDQAAVELPTYEIELTDFEEVLPEPIETDRPEPPLNVHCTIETSHGQQTRRFTGKILKVTHGWIVLETERTESHSVSMPVLEAPYVQLVFCSGSVRMYSDATNETWIPRESIISVNVNHRSAEHSCGNECRTEVKERCIGEACQCSEDVSDSVEPEIQFFPTGPEIKLTPAAAEAKQKKAEGARSDLRNAIAGS